MTLRLEGDLDIMKVYVYTGDKVARLKHLKLLIMDEIGLCMANEKNTKIAFKVKCQGQMLSTFNHF